MELHSSYLDITKFKKDFSHLHGKTDECNSLLESLVERIHEANLSAAAFLRNIDSIEDRKVLEHCRMAAIAQMYNAQLDYRSGYPYVGASAHYEDVLMLCFKNSTAIVSKYGELIFDEGIIWANPRGNFGMGWGVRKVIDGMVSNQYGFITSAGKRVLPCVFSGLDLHIGECNAIYNDVPFRVRIYGAVDDVEKKDLESLVEWCDDNGICCLSEDSILFSLAPTENAKETINKVKSLLSSLVLSKEKIQEIMKSK